MGYTSDDYSGEDWGGIPDERDGAMVRARIGALGNVGPYTYVPDLGPVGSGSAGDYYPRDTAADAGALNYLGFFPDVLYRAHVGTRGSRDADRAAGVGAWSPAFQAAVSGFQEVMMGPSAVDGWIGPATRRKIGEAVLAKNLNQLPIPPPGPLPVPPPQPGPPPGPGPAPAPPTDNTMRNVAIAAGAVVVGGLGYLALRKRRS